MLHSQKKPQYIKALFTAFALILCLSTAQSAEKSNNNVILVIGDSLSAGYGISLEKGWVPLLQQRLIQEKYKYKVVNASISGDTSHGALNRLPKLIQTHKPEIVIIEIGGNDGLRGKPIQATKNNISTMIKISTQQNSKVLLLGIKIPPNLGPRYSNLFYNSYLELANLYKTSHVLFFMQGVADNPEFMQTDGIHANEKAQPILLDNVWQELKKLL